MKSLPGARNALQKFGSSVVKFVGSLIPASGVYGAETQKDISEAAHENNRYLQERREALQLKQMELSVLQYHDNKVFQSDMAERRHQQNKDLEQSRHEFQLKMSKLNQKNQEKLQRYRAQIDLAIQDKNINFQKWKLDQEKALQIEIVNLRQEFDRELAKYNRETALSTIREQRKLANSPITLVSDDLLESPYRNGNMPLRILLSPPEVNYDSFGQKSQGFNIENHLAEELREFLGQNYPFNGSERQAQLLDGAWVSKKFRGGAGIHALYSQLKAVPIIVLESEVDGNYLNFRVAYWQGDGSEYSYQSILSKFPYSDFLFDSARNRAEKWRETRQQLLDKGKSEEQISVMGGDNEFNLFILKEEEQLLKDGFDLSETHIAQQYKINQKDFQKLHESLIIFHCIVTGVIADIHYLLQKNMIVPIFPNLLSELLKEIPDNSDLQKSILDWLISSYDEIYERLKERIGGWIPELTMKFAAALSQLDDKTYAKQQGTKSVEAWLKLRGITSNDRKALHSVVTKDDEPYFQSLQSFLDNIGDNSDLEDLRKLLDDWIILNDLGVVPDSSEVINDESEVEGEEFSFQIVTVNSIGRIVNQTTKTNRQQTFELGNGVKLEMVYIPEGSFLMGSPSGESGSNQNERPQHEVTLQPFWMAKYPITQAQWKAIAELDSVAESLIPDPSHFKGDNRPVEKVSWNHAIEFCKRLSKKVWLEFRLPSEAQWEYACRAGTTTPFHFGETIMGELANYAANQIYANESIGINRQQTLPVGQFPPNAFGLYDMHGNVLEWCADNWHDSYEGAPIEDSAWVNNTNTSEKCVRGGFYQGTPLLCRSASRTKDAHAKIAINIGFRVVCAFART